MIFILTLLKQNIEIKVQYVLVRKHAAYMASTAAIVRYQKEVLDLILNQCKSMYVVYQLDHTYIIALTALTGPSLTNQSIKNAIHNDNM